MRSISSYTVAIIFTVACSSTSEHAVVDTETGTTEVNDSFSDIDTGQPWTAPEIDWITVSAGSYVFGSPPGTPCRGAVTENEVPITITRSFYEKACQEDTAILIHRNCLAASAG